MKRIFHIVLLVSLTVIANATPWTGTIAAGFSGGNGSQATPYLISTGEELAYLASLANASPQTSNANTAGKYYKLTADIDLNGPTKSWTPIGIATATAFAGNFDGDNHSISNIYINDATTVYAGLFGYPTGTASVNVIIKNLTIASGSITVTNASSTVGAFAGRSIYTQFINCKNAINVKGVSQVAGIVGTFGSSTTTGIIEYCSNSGAISCSGAGLHVGGIVGNAAVATTGNTSYIRYCYNTGAVTAVSNAGGIAGSASSGILTIKECFNKGAISAASVDAGGIVGYGYGASFNVLNCYNTATVKQTTSSATSSTNGGILGYPGGNALAKYFKEITNCYNTGAVTATKTGGIVEAIAGALKGGALTTDGTGSVVNSYYLSTLTVTNTNGGRSKTASELQDIAFINSLNNNQIPSVWTNDINGINGGYPILKWETAPKLKPSYQVTNVTKGSITTSGIQLNWTPATVGGITADGYLMKASDGAITDPVDATDPDDVTTFTGGLANVKLVPTATTAPSFSNMLAGTMYNYKIYSYTNSGADILYNTSSVPTANVATMPNEVKGVTLISTGSTTADITWNAANAYNSANHSTLVFVKAANAIIAGTPTLSPSNYSSSTVIGSGTAFENDAAAYCVYKGDGTSVSITGLNSGTKYYVIVYTVVDAANFDVTNSYSVGATEAIYWTGGAGTDTNWSNPLNWSANAVPSSKDQVCIVGGYTATISTNVGTIDKLTLATNADATQPKLLITASGSLSINSDTPNQTQVLLQGGAIENAGSLSVITGTGTSNGINFANSAGTFVVPSTYSGSGTLTINTSVSGNLGSCISFTQTDANPTFFTNGMINLTAAAGNYAIGITAGAATLSGSGTINAGTNVLYGLMKINAASSVTSLTVGAGLTLNSYSSGFSTTSAPLYLGTAFGNKLINNGTINIGGASANGIYSEPTAITNEITNTGTLNLGGFLSQAYIYLGGTGTTTLTNSGTISINGNNTAEGIAVKSNSTTASITNTGTMTFGATGSQARAIALGDSKTVFNNSGTITIGKGSLSGLTGIGKAQFNNLQNGTVNFASPWTKTSNVNDVQLVGTSNLGFFAEKVRNKQPVTLCYLGGSITQGTGASGYSNCYYSKSSAAIIAEITKRGGTATSFNAGVGGTPSSYGAYRVGAQLLTRNPDLLVVEFAVNDGSSSDLSRIDGMEGIVRQAIRQNSKISIVFLYTSMANYQTTYYANGIIPPSVQAFHKVAQKYGITEVLNGPNINAGLINGDYTLATFFPDGTHPSDIGHAVYANVLSATIISGLDQSLPTSDMSLTSLVGTGNLEYARLDGITPIGTAPYWTASKNWYGVPVYTTDSLAKPISFLGKGEGIILKYNGKISVSWTVNGVANYKELTPITGIPYPNTYTLSPNPDGAVITVQAIVNTGVATHGEIWGLFSIQRPTTGNGSGKMAVRPLTKIKTVTPVMTNSKTKISKVNENTLAALVNDSTGIANDVTFNNNGGMFAGYCGIVADNFTGTGIISPGGTGIGKLNYYANTTGGTFALSGNYIASATGKATAGKDFDQINLASADGTLDISGLFLNFTANYSAQLNDTITLLTATKAITGTFNSSTMPANWYLMYDAKSVKAIYDNQTSIFELAKSDLMVYGIEKAIIIQDCAGIKLSIHNTLGQNLISYKVTSNQEKIAIDSGIYFVSNGTQTKKVIVK
ncbi:MAG: GDSL-type esterase/lipase family protein [Paludibacter sp.]